MIRFCVWIAIYLLLQLTGCRPGEPDTLASKETPSIPMVVSVSADGRYAVSSHQDNRLILWDIENRTKEVIAENSNIYSAYFVKGRDVFIWQDLDDVIYVQNLGREILKSFENFSTYGHVLSADLKRYVASDANWNVFSGNGENLQPIKQDGTSPSFYGTGKLLNLTMSPDAEFLLSSGSGLDTRDNKSIQKTPPIEPEQIFSNYAGVVVWEMPSGQPLFKLPGNSAKTNATMSPDGQYVVSGCEGGSSFVWSAESGKLLHQVASLYHGILNRNNTEDYEKWTRDKRGLIPTPEDLGGRNEATLAIKFIDQHHYLRFLTNSPYAVLFHVDNPLPLKYLYLGRNPLPAVRDYVRNAAMDTAPEAGILVMGQQYGDGILVYRYDSEKQKLERVWVAE
ncbi:WD40 repeat domain-containing protein [Geoalkalibacter subterraneus]|uniref:WD40 repeat domain-containing protein n=1 Tax=Geoalkalibacter subterraneus TaxID=483547 RepID=UPI000AA37259|nr:WD40 repeat domain-containing protein [Geoalkalibacter subterraneus]